MPTFRRNILLPPSGLQDDQLKEDEMGGACSAYGEMRNAYKIFVGKPDGKIPLGRHRRRWEDNIKMDLREIG
jgi:hypothetical protein